MGRTRPAHLARVVEFDPVIFLLPSDPCTFDLRDRRVLIRAGAETRLVRRLGLILQPLKPKADEIDSSTGKLQLRSAKLSDGRKPGGELADDA